MSQLTSLNLAGCGVDDAGLSYLEGCACELLYLGDTHITGPGLAHVKAMPRLLVLDLSENRVDAVGLKHLSECAEAQDFGITRLRD